MPTAGEVPADIGALRLVDDEPLGVAGEWVEAELEITGGFVGGHPAAEEQAPDGEWRAVGVARHRFGGEDAEEAPPAEAQPQQLDEGLESSN